MLLPGRPESRLHTLRCLALQFQDISGEDKVREETSVCRSLSCRHTSFSLVTSQTEDRQEVTAWTSTTQSVPARVESACWNGLPRLNLKAHCSDGLPPKLRRRRWHISCVQNHRASWTETMVCVSCQHRTHEEGQTICEQLAPATRQNAEPLRPRTPRGGASCAAMATGVQWQATPAVTREAAFGGRGNACVAVFDFLGGPQLPSVLVDTQLHHPTRSVCLRHVARPGGASASL